ncbi:hypothetical protein GZ77_09030 [Endozoicomonas montiporae]|uniref:HTH cro/C1-type domain-containing protein n=1 Tax=Endozoicomonas montiporae TaxID=1027273 RepID=A0A081N7R8_9GAMM|nr:hypothetical protein GZ77_09030 [Endozoicomonas montiporae]
METIGSRITQLRKAKGWSQSHLAGVIEICTDTKITQQSIQQIESGETKNPRHLEDFATALDVSEKYLRFGED